MTNEDEVLRAMSDDELMRTYEFMKARVDAIVREAQRRGIRDEA